MGPDQSGLFGDDPRHDAADEAQADQQDRASQGRDPRALVPFSASGLGRHIRSGAVMPKRDKPLRMTIRTPLARARRARDRAASSPRIRWRLPSWR